MNDDNYLLPNLLNQKSKPDVLSCWPTNVPSKFLEQGREYRLPFLPNGFFSRIIVRLLNSKIEALELWHNGAILALPAPAREIAKLIFNEEQCMITLLVRVPDYRLPISSNFEENNNTIYRMLLRVIVEQIEMSLEAFYPKLFTSCDRRSICYHCLLRKDPKPFCFPLDEVIQNLSSGNLTVYCHNIRSPSRELQLELLAPDICFVDLPKICGAIDKTAVLGEGSFGKIYLAKWNNLEVAVKSIKESIQGVDRIKFYEFQHEAFLMR